jgi:hypothetical protein
MVAGGVNYSKSHIDDSTDVVTTNPSYDNRVVAQVRSDLVREGHLFPYGGDLVGCANGCVGGEDEGSQSLYWDSEVRWKKMIRGIG